MATAYCELLRFSSLLPYRQRIFTSLLHPGLAGILISETQTEIIRGKLEIWEVPCPFQNCGSCGKGSRGATGLLVEFGKWSQKHPYILGCSV